MVTTIRKFTGGAHPFLEFACLSTDTKPVDLVPDNSICHEIDTGKKYYFANKAWHEAPSRGGGEGGELPENFPAEGIANANKYIGFDANGDYEAKADPSGGAEKFVVTLTQESDTWTADKTIAEIVAADVAGKIVVAKATIDKLDLECDFEKVCIVEEISSVVFSAQLVSDDDDALFYSIAGYVESNEDVWALFEANTKAELPSYTSANNGQILGVSSGAPAWVDSNAPLIVTLTEDQQNPGTLVGDKTFGEVYTAVSAGKTVYIFAMGGYAILNSCALESGTYTIVGAVEGMTFEGTENDYLTVTGN